MADAPWRIGEKDGDNLTILTADTYDGYRQAKREAQVRNEKRRHPRPYWVVIAPSGAICNTGGGEA